MKGLETELLERTLDDADGSLEDYVHHLSRVADAYAAEPELAGWVHAERAMHLTWRLGKTEMARGALERALRLAPGTYANTGLQLQDGARRGQVSVTVRCDGVAVFDRVPFAIDGDVVAVSGVVWRPGPRGVGATFTVRSRLELDRVAVIGAVGGGQIAGPALGVNAGYRTGDHTVVIRDAWFVGNRISGPAIAFGASLPDRFATLTLDRLTFADN
jgi:hypothetical protein